MKSLKGLNGAEMSIEGLTPLLIDIQQNLDGDLNLEYLAAAYGCSTYHFQRVFKELVGETPKRYVQRLRMEKAAYKLWITQQTVIDVGLGVGFKNHETFTRAFRRFYGTSPRDFRSDGRVRKREHLKAQQSWKPEGCVLSHVRFELLRPMWLLTFRHLGDYFEIPEAFSEADTLWRPLMDWAKRHRIGYQPVAMAIFHDNPWLTPKNAQRTDICIPLTAPPAGIERTPMPDVGSVRGMRFEGGLFGIIEHMGPYETLRHAFRRLADTIHESNQYRSPEEPAGAICVKSRLGNMDGRSEVWMSRRKSTQIKFPERTWFEKMKHQICIEINASPERVFPWIDDPERLRAWLPSLVENEILQETDNKIGSSFRQVYLERGRRMEMRGVVTAYEPNRRLACQIRGDAFDLNVDYRLDDLGGRTRLTQDSEVRMKGIFKVIGVVMSPLMRKASTKQAEDSFLKLKTLAES